MNPGELIGRYTLVEPESPLGCLAPCAQVPGAVGHCATGPFIIAEITGIGSRPSPGGPPERFVLIAPAGLICGLAVERGQVPPEILPGPPEIT